MQNRNEHFFEDDDRNRLLEAIEEQAKSLSMARGANQHRLSDWLNAAEEVMPEVKKPAVKSMSLTNSTESKSNTSQIVMFLAVGTLLLAMAGGGTVAYLQLMQQVTALEKNAKSMNTRVDDLEKALQEANQKITTLNALDNASGNTEAASTGQPATNENKSEAHQLESILDERFKQLIDVLDNRMQNKGAANTHTPVMSVTQPTNTNAPTINTPNVAMPSVPQIVEMAPNTTSMPGDANKGGDENQAWLTNLPSDYLLLQLGSNLQAEGLTAMGAKIHNKPELSHVIPVNANGKIRYILVYGGFATREEAKQAADEVKSDLGVSPWIRRAADVRALLHKK
jgi:septal ring-binding cell division protein DamX